MRSFFILFLILLFSSCSQKPAEEVREAIDVALSHLSKEECEAAIEVLEDAGVQSNNAVYLQVLASAYACKAGYDEVKFIANDLNGMVTSSPNAIIKSIASLSLSPESTTDSENYIAIRRALQLLLNSTSTVSHAERVAKFGKRKAGDMGIQALMLNVVNLGKFLNVYGNASSVGVKGAGTNTSSCFINYTDARAQLIVGSGATGACSTNNDGHPDLSFAAANLSSTRRRLCEGLMTVTNILDIMENLDLSSSSELANLAEIASKVGTFKTAAETAGLGTLINMTSQSDCETALQTQSNLDDMELLYAILFETGLQ